MKRKASESKASPELKAASQLFLGSDDEAMKRWSRLTGKQRAIVSFKSCDLSHRILPEINLNQVSADNLKCDGAQLRSARMAGQFRKASFVGADLIGANLSKGDFACASFDSAKLNLAQLSNGKFHGTTFRNTDLTGANLEGALIVGADFSGAILVDVQWRTAVFDKKTQWPTDFPIPGELTWQGTTTDPRLAGHGKKAVAVDLNGVIARLNTFIDPGRMKRTLAMLKREKQHLYAEIEPTVVRGIVQSQTQGDVSYSCALLETGAYLCMDTNLSACFGLDREPCKHILTLVIGLVQSGQLKAETADAWLQAAGKRGPSRAKDIKNHVSDSILKYKGVQAGEVDWRPTETIPEDFYLL